MVDRLTLTDARIDGMAEGVRQVAALPDPVGKILGGNTLPNGLTVIKNLYRSALSELFSSHAPMLR